MEADRARLPPPPRRMEVLPTAGSCGRAEIVELRLGNARVAGQRSIGLTIQNPPLQFPMTRGAGESACLDCTFFISNRSHLGVPRRSSTLRPPTTSYVRHVRKGAVALGKASHKLLHDPMAMDLHFGAAGAGSSPDCGLGKGMCFRHTTSTACHTAGAHRNKASSAVSNYDEFEQERTLSLQDRGHRATS
ncbi:hypothetical protein BP5796_00746 [Coleophoma crateriformis]|uniref:Uncharacterized protein n=1 Tax=Coleophoma crateriformis TaxID=565419 RepID=A0A3D8T8U6_9HELO|nr:hypothetical protein BP5796_00746 [Coleophoma crateriformis]